MRRLWASKAGRVGIVVAVLVVLAVTAGPWAYINLIRDDPPDRLSFDDAAAAEVADDDGDGRATTTSPAAVDRADPADVSGAWTVAEGSQAGYRVKEILFGQDTEGVGRTRDITGTVQIDGTTVTAASFEVDLTTVQSDESRRDAQFRGRIMATDRFPTAAFVLTSPIELAAIPDDLVEIEAVASGELTLRGTTKPVDIELVARRNGSSIEVTGSLTIVFDEWGIPNPSTGPISTEDHGELELLLVLRR